MIRKCEAGRPVRRVAAPWFRGTQIFSRRTMTYRKIKGSDTWHFCTNCSRWPTSNYDQEQSKPTTGELCNECRAKEQNRQCKT
jgi:hypothetical protein